MYLRAFLLKKRISIFTILKGFEENAKNYVPAGIPFEETPSYFERV